MKRVTLLDENFANFAIGEFPHDPRNSAMGEYHYYPPKGYQGRWYCPITDPGWQGPMWIITREGDRKCIESCVMKEPGHDVWNMLTAGDEDWVDYDLELDIKMLSTATLCGIAFRYQNCRCFYALCFTAGQLRLISADTTNSCSWLRRTLPTTAITPTGYGSNAVAQTCAAMLNPLCRSKPTTISTTGAEYLSAPPPPHDSHTSPLQRRSAREIAGASPE